MEKGTKIIIGVVVGLALAGGIGIAIYYSINKKSNQSGSSSNDRATENQFYKFKSLAFDVFDGASESQINGLKQRFVSRITKNEADALNSIASKKEYNWSASEKATFNSLFNKIKQ